MPRNRILTETDGPFAQVDGRNALPWDAQRAVIELATLLKTPIKQVEQELHNNLRSLTSIVSGKCFDILSSQSE